MAKDPYPQPSGQKEPRTVRMHLDRAVVYRGVVYGPGPADVPEEIPTVDVAGNPATLRPAENIRRQLDAARRSDREAGRLTVTPTDEMHYVRRPEEAPLPPEPGVPVGMPGRAAAAEVATTPTPTPAPPPTPTPTPAKK